MTDKLFKPMRSIAPDAKYPVTYPKLASPKLDGIRCCIHKGKALTKSGKPLPNLHTRAWLEANVPEGVDGELIMGNPMLETCYGDTFSAVMTIKGEPDFSFYVFDLCDSPEDARHRKTVLKLVCDGLDRRVVFVEQITVWTDEQAGSEYAKWIGMGYEGMMLVDPASKYLYGRASPKAQQQLKFKPQADFEGEILETLEAMQNDNEAYTNEVGETERSQHQENKTGKGMVGGYRVRDVLTGVIFKVGAGKLTHLQRLAEWTAHLANPQHRLNTYLKYRCMDYGTMTNGAARHGRWIGWRDVTDMNPEDIKEQV